MPQAAKLQVMIVDDQLTMRALVRSGLQQIGIVNWREYAGAEEAWTARVVRREDAASDFDEVAVTRFSTGATFAFEPRRSLPITPV